MLASLGLRGLVALTGWVAVMLMAAWCVAYLRSCLSVLASPGVPIELPYQGTGGDFIARGEDVVFDPIGGRILVGRATLREKGGPELARGRKIQVHLGGPALLVTVAEAEVTLERDARGDLNVTKVVPQGKPGEKAPLLEAKVGVARITWVDRFQGPRLSVPLEVRGVSFSQGPDDTYCRGAVLLDRSPEGRFAYQGSTDGSLWFWLDQPATDATGLLPALRRVVAATAEFDLRQLKATSLVLGGEMEASRQGARGEWGVRGSISAEGDGLSYPVWLDRANVRTRVVGDLNRARVELSSLEGGRRVGFAGTIGLGTQFTLAGDARIALARTNLAWKPLRDLLPRDMSAEGVRFSGPVAVSSAGVRLGGGVSAHRLEAQGEQLQDLQCRVGWDGQSLVLGGVTGLWHGQSVAGALAIVPSEDRIRGHASGRRISIQNVINKYSRLELYGTMEATVLVSGKASRPELSFLARGAGRYSPRGGTAFPMDSFSLQGSLTGQVLDLQRAVVRSRGAVAAANGRLPLTRGRGRIEIATTGIAVEDYTDVGSGTLSAQGALTGTLADWRATGTVELTNGRIGDIAVPLASGRVSGTPDEILVFGAKAAVANGVATGDISWRSVGGALSGSFDYSEGSLSAVSDGRVIGLVSLRDGWIGGTLERPTLGARASADKIRLGEVTVSDVNAQATLADGRVQIQGLQAKLGGGALSGDAEMDWSAQTGLATFQLDEADLGEAGVSREEMDLGGRVSGEGSARFGPDGVRSGEASVSIQDFMFNDSLLGSGTGKVALVGSKVSGQVEIGTLDRYMDLRDVMLDLDSQTLEADLSAYNIALDTFVVATSRWSRDLPSALQAAIRQSEGYLLASGHIGGKVDDPDITGGQLSLTGLKIRGREFGELSAGFERTQGAWEDVSLDWRSGDSALVALGRYDAQGTIEGQIELTKFDLATLTALVPDAPNVRGTLDSMTAVIGGTVDSPEAQASMLLNVIGFTDQDGTNVDFPVSANFDEIGFDRRRARFRGEALVDGFAGSAELTVPWSAFDEENLEREPIAGSLVFAERPLDDLKEILGFLDFDSSEGTVSAEASVSGFAQSIVIVGKGRIQADRLAFQGTTFALKDAAFDVDIGREGASLVGGAGGEAGGTIKVDTKATFAEPLRLGGRMKETLTEAVVSGGVEAGGLVASYLLEGSQHESRGEIEAKVALEGTAGRPILSGYVQAALLEAWLPEAIEDRKPSEIPDVLAFRDFNLLVKSGSRIRSSTLDVRLGGSGTLDGSVSAPRLQLPLVLETGLLRMPTARVRLEPGGVADVRIENFGAGPIVRTTLDVVGRTQVTARRSSGQYERFDVVLEVRGDALATDGLILRARSEPPELTQEEIIALLGRTDLIRAFASGAAGGGFDSGALRETIYGIALPSLTEGFLAEVADQLRLDFVRVDYNPFDLFSVVIGKGLGRGVLLQASRQFAQSATEPLKFDVRLVYRPPFRDRFLQNFRLSLGRNERVPWRLTLDWSTRF